jgi:hypothetical protein
MNPSQNEQRPYNTTRFILTSLCNDWFHRLLDKFILFLDIGLGGDIAGF